MSLRKNPSRNAKKSCVVKTSNRSSTTKSPVKDCNITVSRPKTKKQLPKCTVNLTQLDLKNYLKQTQTSDDKQRNTKNKQSTKKLDGILKYGKENKTKPQINVEKPAPVLNLRSRKLVKYAESSLELTKSEEKPNIQKLPVYKQQIENEESKKRKTDQYEFDSDSEQHKTQKRRKLENPGLDESYKCMVKKVRNNVKKTKDTKLIHSDKKENVKKQKKKNVISKKVESNNNFADLNQITSKPDKKLTAEKNVVKNGVQTKIVGSKKDVGLIKQTQEKIVIGENTTKLNGNFNKPLSSPEQNVENVEIQETPIDNSSDDDFGFAAPEPVKSPRIKILSDIQLTPRRELNVSIASPRFFQEGKPDANSTMMQNVLTPWRFNDINIRRNPHFLALKPSSLPCIDQEMVLDHTIVDKLNESCHVQKENVPQDNKKVKRTVQPKIDEYINPNTEDKGNNESQLSLFDNDQFSPIKTRSRSSGSRVDRVKRKILGERNCDENEIKNASNESLKRSLSDNSKTAEQNKENTYFGFDSDDESEKENLPAKAKDKPFRFSFNVNDKKYERKKKVKIQKAESVVDSDDESDVSKSSDDDENGEVRLFEDFITTKELLENKRRTHKKKNRVNFEDKDFPRYKKRKDVRSKEEEEEAEKWAAAFNSMCEEVEQFPLEIE